MKKLFFLLAVGLVASCTSTDDDTANDGKCWGAIRDVGADGTVYHDVRFQWDCAECGLHVTWYCPEPGTCEYSSATGIWICD